MYIKVWGYDKDGVKKLMFHAITLRSWYKLGKANCIQAGYHGFVGKTIPDSTNGFRGIEFELSDK
jgi:hypothetical protein